jgi:hypothetical protein
MRLRQQSILDKNKGLGNLYKIWLNSSIGQEIINEEKFAKGVLYNTHQTLNNHLNLALLKLWFLLMMFINMN